MGGRAASGLVIVARARKLERLGWNVEQADSGMYKIKAPTGPVVQVHGSPSDVNFEASILQDLNRLGFAEAEAEVAKIEEDERKQRIKRDRETAERRAAREAAQRTALGRAAGPYAPDQVGLKEILAVHTSPVTWHQVQITPEMAKAILERNEPAAPPADWPNRPIRQRDVDTWVTVLRTGRWRYTHQGVALDWDGRLQDGQHRLTAVAQSGITVPFMVSVGMDPDNFRVVDSGKNRTTAQVMRMAGVKNSNVMSAAVRLIYLYDRWGAATIDHARDRVLPDINVDVYRGLDHELLLEAERWAYRLRAEISAPSTASTAFMYTLRTKMPAGSPQVEEFAKLLVEGVVGEDRELSPIFQLRRQLSRQAQGNSRKLLLSAEQLALYVKGWNRWIQGPDESGTRRHLVVKKNAATPLIAVPVEQ